LARKREAAHPTPPVITTRGLEPRELLLEWTRAKSGDAFDFRLLSPKEAPKPPPATKRRTSEPSKPAVKPPVEPPIKPTDAPTDRPPTAPTDPATPKERPGSPEAA
jgi:hypothetical protein